MPTLAPASTGALISASAALVPAEALVVRLFKLSSCSIL